MLAERQRGTGISHEEMLSQMRNERCSIFFFFFISRFNKGESSAACEAL